jgi:2-methylcitrate synthase
MEEEEDKIVVPKGLAGVVVDDTAVSKVMPKSNSLTYRGYAVEELCEKCNFEEVAYLIVFGELPNKAQLTDFSSKERSKRGISTNLDKILSLLPKDAHPMDTLRTGISVLGCEDPRVWEKDDDTNIDKFINMLANIPVVIAASYRYSKGWSPIAPDGSLTMAENFFYMCFGKVPAADIVKAFDVSLILYAEHSFNCSTFATRVITSSESDIYSAICGGIGALKGPLHGGANEYVMHMLKEIEEVDKAEEWMLDALASKKKVMGFGHRVYKTGDSRVPTMTKYAKLVAKATGQEHWLEISDILKKVMLDKKNIHPNLDFPAGPAYYMMGFEIEMFTPIFVMARITGWSAHILEQVASNKLIRPLSNYVGYDQRSVS